MRKPYVHKMYIGKVKEMGHPDAENKMDRPWKSGMFKHPVTEPVWLNTDGFTEDQVADTKKHGGPEKAVFAYPLKHYAYWYDTVGIEIKDLATSAMGENFSVIGTDETDVCIGDTYQCGDAIIQVSQPRRPCWKPARRYRILDLALRIQDSGRTGWYYRVIRPGYIGPGVTLDLLERPYPEWTVAKSNSVMYQEKDNMEKTRALASVDLLAPSWVRSLEKRLRGMESSSDKRVYGPNQ